METVTQVQNVRSLHRPVLILNKSWAPHRIDTVKDVMSLLFREDDGDPEARIIDPYTDFQTYTWEDWSKLRPKTGELALRGVRELYRVPEVVLLTQFDKLPRQRVKFSRRSIHRRDEFVCQYCGKSVKNEGTIDHIVPKCLGGETCWTNCVCCCIPCNQKKDSRTLKEAHMKLLRPPVKPRFEMFKTNGRILKSWKTWITDIDAIVSEVFWEVPLANDMPNDI